MKRIWIKDKTHEMNLSAAFAGSFDIKPGSELRVCAKSIYNVYIDGKFCGNGPSRCAHGRNKTDSFNLSAFAGKSVVITVEVESYNVECFEAANDRPYFSAEIVSGGKAYYTTENFGAYIATDRVQKVSRYSYQRAFSEYYIAGSDVRTKFRGGDFSLFPKAETEESGENEIITERSVKYPSYKKAYGVKSEDGTLDFDDDSPIFTDRFISGVKNGKVNGFSCETWEKDPVDFVSKMIYRKDNRGKYGKYSFYDFGAEYTGFVKQSFDVVSDRATVYFAFDEILTDSLNAESGDVAGLSVNSFNMAVYTKSEGKIVFPFRMRTVNIIAYELGKGHYELQSAEPYSMRYGAVIVREGEIKNENIQLIRFENPDFDKLIFSCRDKALETIINAAKSTFAQNAVDIFMDCPSRERGGWLCDSYFTSMAEKLFTGENIVEAQFLENYSFAPYFDYFEDGVIPMVYPGDYSSERYIPNWMMWYVLELETLIERDGIECITDETKVKVENLIKYFENYENKNGLLEKLPSWVFVEWSRANDFVQDVNYPSNMCYCGMLRAAAKILGRPELCCKADKIRSYIRENARLGNLFIDNAVYNESGVPENTCNTTETCQYYAFYFGIATPMEDKELFDFIVNELGAGRDDTVVYPNIPKSNSFIGNYLRLDYLARNGYAASVAQQCRGYFLYMAEKTGTLWENATTHASCNHGFASYAANILIMGLCGIRLVANRKIYTVPTEFTVDCEIGFPSPDGYVIVKVSDGVREIIAPDGFEII